MRTTTRTPKRRELTTTDTRPNRRPGTGRRRTHRYNLGFTGMPLYRVS